jgi:tetratricopeptide (TPR) repeat protein
MSSEEPWILAGKEAMALGQYERALEIYVDALAKSPSESGYAAAYDVATAIWRYSDAYKIIVSAVTRFPNEPALRFRYGRALAERSNFDLAIDEYKAAIGLGFPADQGYEAVANAYMSRGNLPRAKDVVDAMQEDSEFRKFAEAKLQLATGNKGASTDMFLNLGRSSPNFPELIAAAAQNLVGLGMNTEAIGILSVALSHRPHDPDLQFWLARSLLNEGDLEGAASQLTPVTRSSWLIRGGIAYAKGDFASGYQFLKESLEAEYGRALEIFSYCSLQEGMLQDAIHGYAKWFWLQPRSGRARGAVVYAARRAGDWKTLWEALVSPKKLWARFGFGAK